MLDVFSAVTIGRLDAAEVREFVHTFDLVSIHDDGRDRKKRVDTKVLDLGLWSVIGSLQCSSLHNDNGLRQ